MASGDVTPDEALTLTRLLDGRRRALELQCRRDAEAANAASAEATAREVAALLRSDESDDDDDDDGDGATEDGGTAAMTLHSACISPATPPSAATLRDVFDRLPAEERRLIAALVRQRRAAAAATAA